MRILFIGDIVAKRGREIVKSLLPGLKTKHRIDFVIANGENATHGKGLIYNHYKFLLDAGIDCITLGNHYGDKNEIDSYLDQANQLVRPLNLKKEYPGVGTTLFYSEEGYKIRVTNVLGTVFMHEEVDNPFESLDKILSEEEKADIHIVDFHCEATAEKEAFGWAFDGRVTAIVGTHTHVQTRDARILPQGTGYLTDVGMCGPYNSVLGVKKETIINRMWKNEKTRFEYDDHDEALFSAVVIDVDETTGFTKEMIPIYIVESK